MIPRADSIESRVFVPRYYYSWFRFIALYCTCYLRIAQVPNRRAFNPIWPQTKSNEPQQSLRGVSIVGCSNRLMSVNRRLSHLELLIWTLSTFSQQLICNCQQSLAHNFVEPANSYTSTLHTYCSSNSCRWRSKHSAPRRFVIYDQLEIVSSCLLLPCTAHQSPPPLANERQWQLRDCSSNCLLQQRGRRHACGISDANTCRTLCAR